MSEITTLGTPIATALGASALGLSVLQAATAADVRTLAGAPAATDLATILVNIIDSTSYAAALTDAGRAVLMDNASANSVNLRLDSVADFPVGSVITVGQIGAGVTSVTGLSGVTVNGTDGAAVAVQARWGALVATKIGPNEWWVSGGVA